VVDDHSSDGTVAVAREFPCQVLQLAQNGGPARARNYGARAARGNVLIFVDSDVVVRRDTLQSLCKALEDESVDAVCGMYDIQPLDSDPISLFKNLYIHHVYATSPERIGWFWSGCGAIRARVFTAAGGFDESFPRAAAEDIELGYRLSARGARILLDRRIQVLHRFDLSLSRLFKNDFKKTKYWVRALFRHRDQLLKREGHLDLAMLVNAALFVALSLCLALIPMRVEPFLLAACALAAIFLAVNAREFLFVRRTRGAGFTVFYVVLRFVTHLPILLGLVAGLLALGSRPHKLRTS